MMPLGRPPYMVNFQIEIIVRNNTLYIHRLGISEVQLEQESKQNSFMETIPINK